MNCSDVAVPAKTEKKKVLRPLFDRVLVRVKLESEELVVNGIVRPQITHEKPLEGEVVAVGSGRFEHGERIPLDMKAGDIVTFGKYSGNEVELNGEKLLLLSENEIMAVYE